jgi:hypothetical protein
MNIKTTMKTLKVLAVICMLGAASCAEKNGQSTEAVNDTTTVCDSVPCDSTECDSTCVEASAVVETNETK